MIKHLGWGLLLCLNASADIIVFDIRFNADVYYAQEGQVHMRRCGQAGTKANRECPTLKAEVIAPRAEWIQSVLRIFGVPYPYDSEKGLALLSEHLEISRQRLAASAPLDNKAMLNTEIGTLQKWQTVTARLNEELTVYLDAGKELILKAYASLLHSVPQFAMSPVKVDPKTKNITVSSMVKATLIEFEGLWLGKSETAIAHQRKTLGGQIAAGPKVLSRELNQMGITWTLVPEHSGDPAPGHVYVTYPAQGIYNQPLMRMHPSWREFKVDIEVENLTTGNIARLNPR